MRIIIPALVPAVLGLTVVFATASRPVPTSRHNPYIVTIQTDQPSPINSSACPYVAEHHFGWGEFTDDAGMRRAYNAITRTSRCWEPS